MWAMSIERHPRSSTWGSALASTSLEIILAPIPSELATSGSALHLVRSALRHSGDVAMLRLYKSPPVGTLRRIVHTCGWTECKKAPQRCVPRDPGIKQTV